MIAHCSIGDARRRFIAYGLQRLLKALVGHRYHINSIVIAYWECKAKEGSDRIRIVRRGGHSILIADVDNRLILYNI